MYKNAKVKNLIVLKIKKERERGREKREQCTTCQRCKDIVQDGKR